MLIVKTDITESDIDSIAPRIRKADLREFEAWGLGVKQGLALSAKSSTEKWTAYREDGLPVAVFGFGKSAIRSDWGCVWFIGTDDACLRSPHFLRRSRQFFRSLAAKRLSTGLINYVHKDNVEHIRWLKWLGCEIDDPPFPALRKHFKRFTYVCPRTPSTDAGRHGDVDGRHGRLGS
jgi:hypothetical protein